MKIQVTIHNLPTGYSWTSLWNDRYTAEMTLISNSDLTVFEDIRGVEVVIPREVRQHCVYYFEEVSENEPTP